MKYGRLEMSYKEIRDEHEGFFVGGRFLHHLWIIAFDRNE